MKNKRLVALVSAMLIGATALTTFGSCGRKKKDKYDPNKANIYVATYNGGVGMEWLEDAAMRFEEKYKNAENFQEGRKGVNVIVEGDKNAYKGGTLADNALKKDVYFTEFVEYFTFINKDKVADITDVVTGSMAAYGEEGTIEDKLDPSFKSYLTAGTGDKAGKYYMLPFYDGFYGFTYDVELFENKGFFYDVDGDLGHKLEKDGDREEFEAGKSNGPDGVKGTYDDGLPATYEELKALVQYISTHGCIPFCYSGAKSDYVDKSFRAFIADYEGYDGFNMNYKLNGTTELVTSINSDGTVNTAEETITTADAYKLAKQPGKYYALKMQQELLGTNRYCDNNWNSMEYTTAQKAFIMSKHEEKPYAILAEGVWWENEAATAFSDLEKLRGETKADRRFAFMPIPKLDESRLGPQTMFAANSSFCFINKNCENMELAKEFLRFVHTDAEMSKFTSKTAITRSLEYTISQEDRKNASYFGKSIIDMTQAAEIVYPYSSLEIVINNPSAFTEEAWFLTSLVDGNEYTSPFLAYKDVKGMSAEKYFNGLYKNLENVWKGLKK